MSALNEAGARWHFAGALAVTGREEEGREQIAKAVEVNPARSKMSIYLRGVSQLRDISVADEWVAALRRMGMPE